MGYVFLNELAEALGKTITGVWGATEQQTRLSGQFKYLLIHKQ